MITHDAGNKPGYALFDGPTLVEVSRTFIHPREVRKRWPFHDAGDPLKVIVEIPTSRGGNTPASVDSLITLAITAGRVIGRYEELGQRVRTVTPNQWKGSVPKAIHHKRIKARLTSEELALLVGASGDMIDAVGIGLWDLGRLEGP